MINFSRSLLFLAAVAVSGMASAQFSFTPFEDEIVLRDPAVSYCSVETSGISADGTRISGKRNLWWPQEHPKFGPEQEAVVFTKANGAWSMTLLGDLSEDPPRKPGSLTYGISGDGTRPFGEGSGQVDGYYVGWPILFSPIDMLPRLAFVYSSIRATAINYDGSVVMGYGTGSYSSDPNGPTKVKWHRWKNGAIETMEPLGNSGYPTAVSWDGEVFTGYTHLDMEQNFQAWRYRPGYGFDYLPKPFIYRYFEPKAISGDGKVIVGYGDQDYTSYAWYHTDQTGTVVVPGPGFRYASRFLAANQDGSVLVGYCSSDSSNVVPMLWTPHSGPINLVEYLTSNGVDLGVYELRTATGVSADGTVISGNSYRIHPETGDKETVPFVVKIALPQGIVGFNLSKTSTVGGTAVQATVNLFKTATQDETIELASSVPGAAIVPATVTVPAGSKSVSFPVNTSAVPSDTAVTISAKYGNVSRNQELAVLAPTLKTLRIGYVGYPEPLDAGKPATATVSLSGIAPAGGVPVKVWDNAGAFGLPNSEAEAATVLVPEGQSFVKVTVTTNASTTSLTKSVFAKVGTLTQNVALSIRPWYAVDGLSVLPSNSIPSGMSATGRVRINLPARAGGETVTLATGGTISAPSSVVVPAGERFADFSIQAATVSSGVQTWVKASMGGASKQVGVKVRPPALSSISFPASFTGGSTVSCTIALDGIAAAPVAVNLRDNTGALNTPATATVPAGASSVTISITSNKIAVAQTGKHLIASYAGQSRTATFTINP